MSKVLRFLQSNKSSVIFGLLLLLIAFIEATGHGDFDIFLSASNDLSEGKNIYQIKYHNWYHYYYDVFFALIISPLKYLPLYWANFVWLLLNLCFSYRIWKIILNYLPVDILTKKQIQILTIVSFTLISALWLKNIHLSQMTIFILYLCLEGLSQIEKDKPFWGGLLLGLGISIKIMPIVLIPYLVYRGYFKGAAFAIICTVGILLVPALFIGMEYHWFLLSERWSLINPLNVEHQLDIDERSFHSLTTFLAVLLTDTTGHTLTMSLKRHIANVDLDTLKMIITSVRLILVLGALYFIRSWPFRKTESKLQVLYECSYILLAIPLIFPHQQHYAFFLVFPAITYLVFYYILKFSMQNSLVTLPKKLFWGFLFLFIFFLLNSHFILGAYQNFYDHYKTLTYGILILIPLLAMASPSKIDRFISHKKES